MFAKLVVYQFSCRNGSDVFIDACQHVAEVHISTLYLRNENNLIFLSDFYSQTTLERHIDN